MERCSDEGADMSNYAVFVRIDGEPFLSAARHYRDERLRVREAWQALAREFGADDPGGMQGLIFHSRHAVPKGWSKPDRKGFSKPKKGSEDETRLRNMPRLPRSHDVFGGGVILYDLSYSGTDCWGSGAIGGFFFGPSIGWCGETFFACLPDAAAAAADHLREHPDHKITNGADAWKLPEGLTRVTKAAMDLAMAQHAVAQEREAGEVAA